MEKSHCGGCSVPQCVPQCSPLSTRPRLQCSLQRVIGLVQGLWLLWHCQPSPGLLQVTLLCHKEPAVLDQQDQPLQLSQPFANDTDWGGPTRSPPCGPGAAEHQLPHARDSEPAPRPWLRASLTLCRSGKACLPECCSQQEGALPLAWLQGQFSLLYLNHFKISNYPTETNRYC